MLKTWGLGGATHVFCGQFFGKDAKYDTSALHFLKRPNRLKNEDREVQGIYQEILKKSKKIVKSAHFDLKDIKTRSFRKMCT